MPARRKTVKRKNDEIDHPVHYTSLNGGIECIDVVQHMNFCRGAAVKYIWRAGLKGGAEKEVQDLRKAIWFLRAEIARITK
jgi:hypothetical protein